MDNSEQHSVVSSTSSGGDFVGRHLHTPSNTALASVELDKAAEALKLECEEIWQTVCELQHKLDTKNTCKPLDSDDTLTSVNCTKVKLLQAQIEALSLTKPSVLPQDQAALRAILRKELVTSISQLEVVHLFVQSEHAELLAEKEREQALIDKLTQSKAVLEEKLDKDEAVSHSRLLQDVEKKKAHVKEYCRKLIKKMNKFVQEHFPPPSVELLDQWRKQQRRRSLPSLDNDTFVPLQTVLEDLLNRCIETPHDPYLTLTSSHWPPQVELLVRCGIARRNPDNDNAIRLGEFHF